MSKKEQLLSQLDNYIMQRDNIENMIEEIYFELDRLDVEEIKEVAV